MIPISEKHLVRFWNKVEVRGADDCWNWKASISSAGYGVLQIRPFGTFNSHRIAFQINHGEIPSGKVVMHTCDNRRCVNPQHLKLGTYSENTQDMVQKGRNRVPFGENHFRAKLKASDVIEIRKMFQSGVNAAELAHKYGVHKDTIRNAVVRGGWACLNNSL